MASNIKFLVINEKRVQNIYAFLFDHLEYTTNSMKEKSCKYNYILELLAWHALINILLTRSTDKRIDKKIDGWIFIIWLFILLKKTHKIIHGNRGEIGKASKQTPHKHSLRAQSWHTMGQKCKGLSLRHISSLSLPNSLSSTPLQTWPNSLCSGKNWLKGWVCSSVISHLLMTL